MNRGIIENNIYEKIVNFSKAVLWKDRQLSVPVDIFKQIKKEKCFEMRYIDRGKGEIWKFKVEDIEKNHELKTVGQEEQMYFPIELAKKISIEDNKWKEFSKNYL